MLESQASIVIINPLPGKGTDRTDISTSASFDERGNPRNELDIGAIVYGVDGLPTATEDVVVTVQPPNGADPIATTIHGTGNVTPIYPNQQKQVVPYYPYHFLFMTAGEYIFKFSALNLDQQTTVQVSN